MDASRLTNHRYRGRRPTVYLCDRITAPTFLASFARNMNRNYTGALIRVRRASDNAELDIGTIGNFLDVAALATFCAGTNGFVKTAYDQMSAGNFTQTTLSAQPKIWDSVTGLVVAGRKPAAQWDGSNDVLAGSAPLTYGFNGNPAMTVAITCKTAGTNINVSAAIGGNNAGGAFNLNSIHDDDLSNPGSLLRAGVGNNNGIRLFTAQDSSAAVRALIGLKPSAGLQSSHRARQDGIELSQSSIVTPGSALLLQNSICRWGSSAATAASFFSNMTSNFLGFWVAELGAADLAYVEAEMAWHGQ